MAILMVVDQVADMKTLLPLACAVALAEETSLCLLRRLGSADTKPDANGAAGKGERKQGGDPDAGKTKNADSHADAPDNEDTGEGSPQNSAETNVPGDPDADESTGSDTNQSADSDTDESTDSDTGKSGGSETGEPRDAGDAPADPDAARREAFTRAANAAVENVAGSLQRPAPACKVVFLADGDPAVALQREMQARKPSLALLPASMLPKQHAEAWVHSLCEKTGTDILVCQASSTGGIPRRILIPTTGGRHAPAALRLAKDVLGVAGGEAICLTVETFLDPDAAEIASHVARRVLEKAGIKEGDGIVAKGMGARDPHDAILERAKDGFELVLVGASPRRQGVLRGTPSLSRRLLEERAARMVGVMYRAPGGAGQVLGHLRSGIRAMLPALGRDRRIAVFEQIRDGSRFGIDFGLMLALSSAIAALGLMQNSTAVVIGAMLVAPLMTPMIGFALSIVQANLRLAKDCLLSILIGTALAVGIAALLGGVAGAGGVSNGLTDELLARCGPGLLDLGVAVFSGMAGAYAIARPNLSGAVAGVAIAAALVPPLATTGILLSWGEISMAKLAFVLFTVNLVAIVLGAFLAFRLVGLGGAGTTGSDRVWPLRTLIFLLLSILLFVMVFSHTPARSRWMGIKGGTHPEPEAEGSP